MDGTIICPVTQARSHTGYTPFLPTTQQSPSPIFYLSKCVSYLVSPPHLHCPYSLLSPHMNYYNNFLTGPHSYLNLLYFIIHTATILISLKKQMRQCNSPA